MKIQIEAELSELAKFFHLCDNLHYQEDDACNHCPLERECEFYYCGVDNGGKLDGLQDAVAALKSK